MPLSQKIPPPGMTRQATAKDMNGHGAGSAGAAAAAAAAAGTAPLLHGGEEGDGEESEEEEESEEAQMCWSVAFTFFPVIIEVVTEFSGAAMEAVRAEGSDGG